MESLPPEAFLRVNAFFDVVVEQNDDQTAGVNTDGGAEKVSKDLVLLEQFLAGFRPIFLERRDPAMIEEEKRRNMKVKKTSIMRAFRPDI